MAKMKTSSTTRKRGAKARGAASTPRTMAFAGKAAVKKAYAKASRKYALTSKILFEN
jgi:hypothetical protein